MKIDFNLIARRFNRHNKYYVMNKRRKYKQSYPHTEFECKVVFTPIKLNEIIRFVLTNIKNSRIEIDEIVQRREFHHFYNNKSMHRVFIFLRGSREVWIKEKSKARVAHTHKFSIPVIVREEKKLKPTDPIYQNYFLETLKWNYLGSFSKECVDISFWFKNFLYTITIAESSTGWQKFSQIEIEYDGHSLHAKRPSKKTVLSLFDEIVPLIIPKSAMYFTTETKLQWLQSSRNS